MLLWMGETVRPTRDADLLGLGDLSNDFLVHIFRGFCALDVQPDWMEYLTESVRLARIRRGDEHGGRRVTLEARLGNARLSLQIDIGIGDVITPGSSWVELPGLLGLPSSRLLAYPPETSIAEKLETMVSLGLLNSRLRDYFDIFVLAERTAFDGAVLTEAVRRTFGRRSTSIPDGLPLGLSAEFAAEPGKQTQWVNFRLKLSESVVPAELVAVVERIGSFVEPVLRAAKDGEPFIERGHRADNGSARRSSPRWNSSLLSSWCWLVARAIAATSQHPCRAHSQCGRLYHESCRLSRHSPRGKPSAA